MNRMEARVMKRIADGRETFGEIFRYLIVGGLAFILDFATLCTFKEFVLQDIQYGLYISTALGFLAGLALNYILSINFVFRSAKSANAGRSFRDFVIFALVGIIGLLLSEAGMFLGADLMGINYKIVKLGVTFLVLLWNYLGRKYLIFSVRK